MSTVIWRTFLDALLDAAWVIDPKTLRIVAANRIALDLVGLSVTELIGKPIVELTVTPEDMYFWEDVAAGLADSIYSETLLRSVDGTAIAVERRVSRVSLTADEPMFLMNARDLREQQQTRIELEDRAAELASTLESSADGILVTDLDGAVRNYNRRFAQLWAVPDEVLEAPTSQSLQSHMLNQVRDTDVYLARLQQLADEQLREGCDLVHLHNGHILERTSVAQCSRGRTMGRVYAFRDVTERALVESRLQLAAKVFDSSMDAIFITDAQFSILQVNPRCERLTGSSRAQLLGTPARQMFHDPAQPDFFDQVELGLAFAGKWAGEVWRMAGEQPCAVEVNWVALRNDAGEFTHTVCLFQDLTEKLEAQRRIETLAYTDVLTGLPNRLLLTQRVDLAIRMVQRSGGSCAVLFINLDRFKNINDSLGHTLGDRVLVEVSQRMRLCLREVDTLCRLAADEFVAFLQDANALGAEIVTRRILQMVAQPFEVDGTSFSLGCSIGIAMCAEDGRTVDELIQCANTAMHRVKERGRGNFRFYQPQMNVDWLSRIKLDHAMRQGMEQQRFQLHYQPQVSLEDGHLLGAEALLRWVDPELGNVSPATFIPLAEESGFIIKIGNWVLQEAVRQATLWQNQGMPVVVSINVSALQFQQSDFVERVANCLRGAQLAPALLELELTESILIRDANEALARLHALAALGISLAIDDFGTGYSSLAYLKKFPISKLKIDRAFVMGLPADESDRAIVSATIGMARALKFTVVAEGVETPAQRDYLQELQCASYQGFLCSKGLPAAEFEQLVARLPSAILNS